MKNKFLQFFTKSKILTEKEFDSIKDICDFNVSKNNLGILIEIDINSLIDPKFFFKILQKFQKYNNDVQIKVNLSNIIYNSIDVQKYIRYYSEKTNNILFKNIVNRKECEIENNNLKIFYLNLNEREYLIDEKVNLSKFLNFVGVNFNDIIFIMDEKHKEIELYKSKKFNPKRISENDKIIKENIKTRSINIPGYIDTIASLVPEQINAIIFGTIFKIDKIQLSASRAIYKFFVTDYSDSIIIKVFSSEKYDFSIEFLDSIKLGDWIKARILLQVDKYEKNQLTGIAKKMSIEERPKSFSKVDNSEIKRVEFINHTKMTAFEGLSSGKDLVNDLINFNHKYLAITDKYNCQIFPSIYKYKKDKNINLIYGFQTFLEKEIIDVVSNPIDRNIFESEYVIFDIETTGLYPLVDDIIEFGAIKYKGGSVIDKINFFIKTDIKLSNFIKHLTNINDDDIKNGLDEKEALIKIKEFFGDSILVAHNGKDFDMKFINKKLENNNLEIIKNPFIDSLLVSRAKNIKSKRHSLSYLAKKLNIFYNEDEAHRAIFDAEVLLKIWRDMLEYFEKNNIDNLLNINNKLNCIELISKNRAPLINVHAKNQKGLNILYNLISKASTNKYSKSVLFKKDFNDFHDDIIISNSPSEGDVLKEAFYGTDDELKKVISFYDVIFISPISCFDHEINRGNFKKEDIKKAINRIIEISNFLSKKIIASADTYYINEEDSKFYEIYVHTKGIGGKRHRIYSFKEDNTVLPKLHFRTTDEMLDDFNFLGKEKSFEIVVVNSNELASKIKYDIVPVKEVLSTPIIDGAKEKLKDLVSKNTLLKYGEKPDESITIRINRELKSIINNGFSVIYWFSHLLVKKSLDDGYMVGSRGSVGSSLVATLVNITEVNPLAPHYLCDKCKYFKYVTSNINSGFDLPSINCPNCNSLMNGDGHNIPFETFMGFDGEKVPDIDLNFSAEYQSKAHEFIRETFGKENVLRAGTIGTVAERTAFSYVKSFFESIGKLDVRDAEIIRIAIKCEGVKRTTGQHPGGIIVIPREESVFSFTPYNFPADDNTQDWYTTHFAFEFLHDSLLKFDILGHDSPTVIKMLENSTKINPKIIPNYDSKVMDIFKSSLALGITNDEYKNIPGTLGLPEFGTNFVKEMLIVTKPRNFSDLVRISGLSHGTNVWKNNAKDLIEKNNLDISEVISSRDDIMVYLMSKNIDSLLSFQIMEDIRKGKGLSDKKVEILKSNNIPSWYIDSCNKIEYLFPKAHATAYVDMAWKIAWFKLYYPLHFYASFFTIRSTVFDLENIIIGKQRINNILTDIKARLSNPTTKQLVTNKEIDLISIYEITLEMIERGFVIKNIDLEKSLENEYIITSDGLIPPFLCLDGLGAAVAKSIIEARNEKNFTSKDDLIKRTKITKTHFKKLNDLGVLDKLMDDEQISLFE